MSSPINENLIGSAGKLIMVGFQGREPTAHLRRMIEEYRVGGVILFSRNVSTATQLRDLTSKIQSIADSAGYSLPLLIALDQEGGLVNRITKGVAISPGNMALGATKQPKLARRTGKILGRELSSLGVNMNLAPVLDVSREFKGHLKTRCFGENPELVGRLGREFAAGMSGQGVMPIGKHFVGYGGSPIDPHGNLPHNDLSKNKLRESLSPFKLALPALEGIMSAHVIVESYDEEFPVTMSRKVLEEILRQKLDFSGPIVTDCLEMGAIQSYFETGEALINSLKAGADLFIISHKEKEQIAGIKTLKDSLVSGAIEEEKFLRARRRVDEIRESVAKTTSRGYELKKDKREMTEIAGEAITLLEGNVPGLGHEDRVLALVPELKEGFCLPVQLEGANRFSILPYFEDSGPEIKQISYTENQVDEPKITNLVANKDKVIFFSKSPGGIEELTEILNKEAEELIIVLIGDPRGSFGLTADCILTTYGRTPASLRALVEILTGDQDPGGEMPVSSRLPEPADEN